MSSARKIVVAEDEESDVVLLRHALDRAGLGAEVEFARDGEEAIECLRRNESCPVLLLLDLRMPRVDGFEVMQRLREDGLASDVSVVVMSSSGETSDICRAAALGAKAYIVKPQDPRELVRVMERLANFWEIPEGATITA